MRKTIACLCVSATLAGCATAPTPAPAPEGAAPSPATQAMTTQALPPDPAVAGTWVPVVAELGSQEFKFGQDFRLVVTADRYEIFGMPEKDSGRLVYVGGDPRGFDVVGEQGQSKGVRFPAIYRFLPDGRMEVCYDLEGQGRPAAFTTFPGTKLFKVIYKRG